MRKDELRRGRRFWRHHFHRCQRHELAALNDLRNRFVNRFAVRVEAERSQRRLEVLDLANRRVDRRVIDRVGAADRRRQNPRAAIGLRRELVGRVAAVGVLEGRHEFLAALAGVRVAGFHAPPTISPSALSPACLSTAGELKPLPPMIGPV